MTDFAKRLQEMYPIRPEPKKASKVIGRDAGLIGITPHLSSNSFLAIRAGKELPKM